MTRSTWIKAFVLAAAFAGVWRRRNGLSRRIGPTICTGPMFRPRSPAVVPTTRGCTTNSTSTPKNSESSPRIQGPYYRNYYGGKRIFGLRHPHGWHDWDKKKYYQGHHFILDVF